MMRHGIARLRALVLSALIAAGAAGCSLIPVPEDPPVLFTLSPKNTFDETLPVISKQLVIEVPVAAEGLNSHRIALSREALSLDYYAKARWTERAPLLVQTLLVESFENTGRIVSVAREGTDLRADFALKTELREFQAEYPDPDGPPEINVRIIAKLIKLPERAIISAESFGTTFESTGTAMPEIVVAFDEALGKVLKRIVTWAMPQLTN